MKPMEEMNRHYIHALKLEEPCCQLTIEATGEQ
jgi:hypothetical protein